MYTYIHTHTSIPTRKTIYISKDAKTTLYISEGRKETISKLLAILKRENISFSSWLFKHAKEYVRLHEPGNPQQRLDTIMDLGRAYNANKCNMCDAKPMFQCFLGKKSVLLCEDHFDQKKSWFTGWKKL